jgi:hypothetical protein
VSLTVPADSNASSTRSLTISGEATRQDDQKNRDQNEGLGVAGLRVGDVGVAIDTPGLSCAPTPLPK